jgi:hypothetical protein
MKKNRDELIVVIIHNTWKCHKETFCVTTFISNKQKYLFLFHFSSTKLENRWAEQGGGRLVLVGRGRWWGKGAEG